MTNLDKMYTRNARALAEAEPTFAPQFDAALRLLHTAHVGNGGLCFPRGVTCGPQGCTCNERACLHRVAFRVYRGE